MKTTLQQTSEPVLSYASPATEIHILDCEGMLCTSGSHDSFIENDEWIDLLD